MKAPKILMAISMLWVFSTASLISCGGTSKKTYTISGTVSGAVAAGVSVSLSGASTDTATTDGTGAYTFTGLANGSYTVTPSLTGYTFAPVSLDVVVSNANMSGKDFVATRSCADVCAKIGGTDAGECNSVTNSTVDQCNTLCNQYKGIVNDDAWNNVNSCILGANCDAAMFTTCLTTAANLITNDNLSVVKSSLCASCQAGAANTACLSSLDTVLAQPQFSSYVAWINLINTSTLDCFTTCYQNPSQPCYASQIEFLGALTQINTCLTNCQIPT